MAFLTDEQVGEFKQKIITDESILKKIYNSKKKAYMEKSVVYNEVDDNISDGWEKYREFKTKCKLRKTKSHDKLFEDKVWCQFYDLGYEILNRDENCELFFKTKNGLIDKKQIDVLAINNETAFIIECKSSENWRKPPSYKEDFDALGHRIQGFREALRQMYGRELKVKYIFATRNIQFPKNSLDLERLKNAGGFHYNDNTTRYIDSLIKNYKNAAIYQFMGLMFKNEDINKNMIEIPAIRGTMGDKRYYMFSIEPGILLKIGFILHRIKANDNTYDMPTYQRLLVPNRLKKIENFIKEGGYFPNSLIINFDEKEKILFEPSSKIKDSKSKFGILKIPNKYAIAYIIDGQHRLYGYANTKYKDTNTVPVVAMFGLEPTEQLEIFMDINQNQKAVDASLKVTLEADLHWNSPKIDSRLKALKSSIVQGLTEENGPLFGKITIGGDKAEYSGTAFYNGLTKSGLLPKATATKYIENTTKYCLYNTNNHKFEEEMFDSKDRIVSLLNSCFSILSSAEHDTKLFFYNSRGVVPFLIFVGSINTYLCQTSSITNANIDDEERTDIISEYIKLLVNDLNSLSDEEKNRYLSLQGGQVENKWLRLYQDILNKKVSKFVPDGLEEWKEEQNDELQGIGREYGIQIEKFMKHTILDKMLTIYGTSWDKKIGSIKRDCVSRALQEDEKNDKEGLDVPDVDWKEMFNINDYKTIIEKHWNKKPEDVEKFITMEDIFSIDIGSGNNGKSEGLKWISLFNSYRNLWAHEGTKEKRLKKKEVDFLKNIYEQFNLDK